MFGKEKRSLLDALGAMRTEATRRSNFSESMARTTMAEMVANDRRFDGYDHGKLVDRVKACLSNGAVLDLDDPSLRRGPEQQPTARRRFHDY